MLISSGSGVSMRSEAEGTDRRGGDGVPTGVVCNDQVLVGDHQGRAGEEAPAAPARALGAPPPLVGFIQGEQISPGDREPGQLGVSQGCERRCVAVGDEHLQVVQTLVDAAAQGAGQDLSIGFSLSDQGRFSRGGRPELRMEVKRHERANSNAAVLDVTCCLVKRSAWPGVRCTQRADHQLACWWQVCGQCVERVDQKGGGTFRCDDDGDDVPQRAHG
uniref:Uncharacterized protein n=1 Tax=uncultured bacterium esnapd10 TaxID=1366590 RepID=S5TUE9_9BACT|nr:hypothetical protein [uncultured bacterium esnapd10]